MNIHIHILAVALASAVSAFGDTVPAPPPMPQAAATNNPTAQRPDPPTNLRVMPQAPTNMFAGAAQRGLRDAAANLMALTSQLELYVTNGISSYEAISRLGCDLKDIAVTNFGMSFPLGQELSCQVTTKRMMLSRARVKSSDQGASGDIYTQIIDRIEPQLARYVAARQGVTEIHDDLLAKAGQLRDLASAVRFSQEIGVPASPDGIARDLTRTLVSLQATLAKIHSIVEALDP